jgi:hypothetical protein
MGAPVAVFVYKRPQHAAEALQHLVACPEAKNTQIFVFSDGPRSSAEVPLVEATRDVVRSFAGQGIRLVEREANRGLAKSIIAGVTQLCSEFGRVIVLEDDLVVAPVFLDYMNSALERYRDEPRVVQITGYMHPVSISADTDAVLLPLTSSWGWATWERAWAKFDAGPGPYLTLKANRRLRREFDLRGAYPYFDMLERQARGRVDSWAIRWYASTFLAGGLTLWPRWPLVHHGGFDGSGTHGGALVQRPPRELLEARPVSVFPAPAVNEPATESVRRFIRQQRSLIGRIRRRLSSRWNQEKSQ